MTPDDCPRRRVLTFLLGMSALVGAAPAFAGETTLEDYDALIRAERLAEEGSGPAALDALGAVSTSSASCRAVRGLLHERATLLRAELLAESDPSTSADLLMQLPVSGSRYKTAIGRYRTAGDEEAARAAEVRLLINGAAGKTARRLARRLGAEGVTKRLGSPEQELQRIRVLLATHVNDKAHHEAIALATRLGTKHPRACELMYIAGKASRKRRKYGPAIDALAKARRICLSTKNDDFAARSALLEVRVRGIRGQAKGTAAVARWLDKHFPKHTFRDDAWMIVAQAQARNGLADQGRMTYARVASQDDADHASLAAWRLALEDLENDRRPQAIARLDNILERDVPRVSEHHRALYWRAKLEKDPEKRRAFYGRLTERPSFYTWLAIDRARSEDPALAEYLENILLEIKSHAERAPKTSPLLADAQMRTRYERALALRAKDELDLAADELAHLECGKPNDETAYALARAYHEIGAYPRAQWVVRTRKRLLERLDAQTFPVWTVAYSRAYEAQIAEAAKKAKLEKWFLLGLVREESTFDPNIVSWAGAVGLAQLMPPTAIGAFAEVYRGRLNLARLTDPELNLRLGGHVLAQGLRRFGSEPLALAAYNGGPGLTRRALPKRTTDFDLWVETIAVKETRRYVKRVTETWGLYRYLYGTKPFVSLPKVVRPKK